MTTDRAARCARILAIYREMAEDAKKVAEIERHKASLLAELESIMPDHLADTQKIIDEWRARK